MNKSMLEIFGEPISVYTEEQALDDGVLMKNPSNLFGECSLITTNLWGYIERKANESMLTEPIDLLNIIMKKANDTYRKSKFRGDNDRDFFVLNNGQLNPIWFVRNGNNKLTAMLSEDY